MGECDRLAVRPRGVPPVYDVRMLTKRCKTMSNDSEAPIFHHSTLMESSTDFVKEGEREKRTIERGKKENREYRYNRYRSRRDEHQKLFEEPRQVKVPTPQDSNSHYLILQSRRRKNLPQGRRVPTLRRKTALRFLDRNGRASVVGV